VESPSLGLDRQWGGGYYKELKGFSPAASMQEFQEPFCQEAMHWVYSMGLKALGYFTSINKGF
jgi:hypothetical protein